MNLVQATAEKSTKPVHRKSVILRDSGNLQSNLVCPDNRQPIPRRIVAPATFKNKSRGVGSFGVSATENRTQDTERIKPRVVVTSRPARKKIEATPKKDLDVSRLSTILELTEVK